MLTNMSIISRLFIILQPVIKLLNNTYDTIQFYYQRNKCIYNLSENINKKLLQSLPNMYYDTKLFIQDSISILFYINKLLLLLINSL